MKRIALKFSIFFIIQLPTLLLFSICGAILGWLCFNISPDFSVALHGKSANGSPQLDAILVGAVFNGFLGLYVGVLTGLAALIFKEPREMLKKIVNSFSIDLSAAILFALLSIVYAMYLTKDGRLPHPAPDLFPRIHSIENFRAWYLFFGCETGLVIGFLISCGLIFRSRFIQPSSAGHVSTLFRPLTQLLYPPNGLKYLLLLVSILSFFWEFNFLGKISIFGTYVTLFGSVMWVVATMYVYDFSAAMLGRSSPFMYKFYSKIARDICIPGVVGLTIFALNAALPAKYSFKDLDVGTLYIGSLLFGFLALLDCAKMKIAGNRLSHSMMLFLCAVALGSYLLSFYAFYLIRYSDAEMTTSQALWSQITILCISIYVFVSAYQLRFFLEEEHIEASPIFLDFCASVKMSPSLYLQAAEMADQWNYQVKLAKIRHRLKKAGTKKRRKK